MSLRQPFGVVAIVIPWNAPLIFFSKKVAPAVAAGNCVVAKSSEKALLASWKVSQWIEKCGFPPDVINVLSGHSQISGQALSKHMKVRALSFTGSTRTGRAIQIASATSNLKKVVFELGSKSPAIIFEDADVELAAKETENSINWNSGQICMANSRIYIQNTIKDQFIEAFTKHAKKAGPSAIPPAHPQTTAPKPTKPSIGLSSTTSPSSNPKPAKQSTQPLPHPPHRPNPCSSTP